MELIDKANILADYWMDYRNDPDWQDFMTYNDIGLPLSDGLAGGFIIELSEAGEAIINESFSMLCKKLGIEDTTADETLEDFLERA